MAGLYENNIKQLKESVIANIKDASPIIINKCFDALSILYLNEYVHYSEDIEKEESREEKEKIRKELTSTMDDWRETISIQEKWGDIH
jgi:hypothetical protein